MAPSIRHPCALRPFRAVWLQTDWIAAIEPLGDEIVRPLPLDLVVGDSGEVDAENIALLEVHAS